MDAETLGDVRLVVENLMGIIFLSMEGPSVAFAEKTTLYSDDKPKYSIGMCVRSAGHQQGDPLRAFSAMQGGPQGALTMRELLGNPRLAETVHFGCDRIQSYDSEMDLESILDLTATEAYSMLTSFYGM